MSAHTVTLSYTVPVDAPAAHVFDCLVDWPSQSEWIVATTVRATKQQGRGVGGGIAAYTGIGPVGFTDTMEITAWDPPYHCSVKHTGAVVKGTGDFSVTAITEKTSSFTWSETLILPFGAMGKFGWPAAQPFALWGIRISLKRFARWAEKSK